ncbi:MAG: acetate--CoA ligase alpha subunit [Methanomassiliicoccales archaeon]
MKSLFEPQSIAVVGAAREKGKLGNIIIRNLQAAGFEGDIYPVNPKADEILGLKCYSSIGEIPDQVDLAVIVVPNFVVPGVIEEAGENGVKGAIIISAGFKEIGKEGAELENKVGQLAKEYGMRILGPNCLGLINTHHDLNATFTRNYPLKGRIAVTSQSGAICTSILDWAKRYKMGFSKFISVGNKVDVDEADLLGYLGEDGETGVIGMYIEGTDRGKEFLRMAKETTRNKPILALKSGRTSSGAKAASSHTGALSGSDAVYETALEQTGVVRAKTIDEFFDLLQVFSQMPIPEGDGVAIVTNAGGLGVMAADATADFGLNLASFQNETIEELKENLPAEANFYNPVDVLGDAPAERYEFAIETVMADPNVSMVLAVLAPTDTVDILSVADIVSRFSKKVKTTPLVATFVGGGDCDEGIEMLRDAGIPNYESPDRAMKALSAMVKYRDLRDTRVEDEPVSIEGDKQKVKEILDVVKSEDRLTLREDEGKAILRAYDVPTPNERTATTPEEAAEIAEEIGYPVVMKVASPDIFHKTDVGGVAVGVSTSEDVMAKFDIIMQKSRDRMPQARIEGVSVQEMMDGREVIVGMVRDDQFGPVLTFGLGGIFVEIMKDVSQKIAPLTQTDVDRMISSIKAYPILSGARGRSPADIKSLKKVIYGVAQISLDFPEISEFEINPVIVKDEGEGCGAVDALVTIRRESE